MSVGPRFPVVVDGVVHPPGTPVLPAEDRGFLIGLAVFETVHVDEGHPLFLAAHAERLAEGAASIGLEPPDWERLARTARRTVEAAPVASFALRLTWTAGVDAPMLLGTGRAVIERDARGLVATLSPYRLPLDELTRIKSTSRLRHTLARAEATGRGFDEALLLNHEGDLAEGTISNVFVVHAGALATPGLDRGCLGGLTRARLIESLAERPLETGGEVPGGPPLEVRRVALEELREAREVLLTGSTARVVGLRSLELAPGETRALPGNEGPAARALLARLRELERADRARDPWTRD